MGTVKVIRTHHEAGSQFEDGQFGRSELMKQLERLVQSKHFRNSKRYPNFLRFVVEQTLAGKTDELKERTLGVSVFGRPDTYDTNDDPVVRVTAGEIRKRIAQYYQEPGHEEEIRIDLPLGSYIPHFLPPAHSVRSESQHAGGQTDELVAASSVQEHDVVGPEELSTASEKAAIEKRRRAITVKVLLCLLVIAVVFGAGLLRQRYQRDQGIDYFWHPVIASGAPALIVIGVHSLDERGQDKPASTHPGSMRDKNENMLSSMVRSDMVPVSDIVSYSKVTDLLTRRSRNYQTKGAADTTLEDLRRGPVILIGGLDNIWTKRLVAPLRYNFFAPTQLESEIRDNKDPSRGWKFDNMQLVTGNSRDYAIVASYFDSMIGQHVLIVAGIGKAGTQAAAEFLTSNQDLKSWLVQKRVSPGNNVELVLATDILDGQPGPPHVIASSVW